MTNVIETTTVSVEKSAPARKPRGKAASKPRSLEARAKLQLQRIAKEKAAKAAAKAAKSARKQVTLAEFDKAKKDKPRTSGAMPKNWAIAAKGKNPSRKGTAAFDHFERIKRSKTVADYVKKGGAQNYLVWFYDRGFVTVTEQ